MNFQQTRRKPCPLVNWLHKRTTVHPKCVAATTACKKLSKRKLETTLLLSIVTHTLNHVLSDYARVAVHVKETLSNRRSRVTGVNWKIRRTGDFYIWAMHYLNRIFMRAKMMNNLKIPGEIIARLISEAAVNLTDRC